MQAAFELAFVPSFFMVDRLPAAALCPIELSADSPASGTGPEDGRTEQSLFVDLDHI
jgi:hypothetical protein